MTTKIAMETLDAVRRRLAVEVPADEVAAETERAFADLGRAARVRGFRPGRVPRPVLERLFGDQVRGEVFEKLIQRTYAEAIETNQVFAVGRPEIVTEQLGPGEPLRYRATVEVKPEVVADRYKGLEIERPLPAVTDEDVRGALEHMRESFAQLHPVTDRATVEPGDVVTLDYAGHVDGKLAGRREGRLVEVGASGFPPDFDAHLIGAAVGTEQAFEVTYPAEPRVGELSGKTVHFRVTVRALARKEVPALDDEFAKDHGDCATLDELRGRVRGQLEAEAAAHADELGRRAALHKLAEVHDIPIPQAMVERRTEGLLREVLREWEQQRVRPKNEAEALARLREDLTPRAREQVKVALLLEAVAQQEGLHVDDADVDARIAALATAAGQAAERVRALYQDPDARRDLRAQLLQARALDAVLRQAHVTTVPAENSVAAPE